MRKEVWGRAGGNRKNVRQREGGEVGRKGGEEQRRE